MESSHHIERYDGRSSRKKAYRGTWRPWSTSWVIARGAWACVAWLRAQEKGGGDRQREPVISRSAWRNLSSKVFVNAPLCVSSTTKIFRRLLGWYSLFVGRKLFLLFFRSWGMRGKLCGFKKQGLEFEGRYFKYFTFRQRHRLSWLIYSHSAINELILCHLPQLWLIRLPFTVNKLLCDLHCQSSEVQYRNTQAERVRIYFYEYSFLIQLLQVDPAASKPRENLFVFGFYLIYSPENKIVVHIMSQHVLGGFSATNA